MTVETILAGLQKVRKTAPGAWVACCPAHEDKSPSLSVSELPDGRILVHCHAGCDISQVLGALGLEFDALYPDSRISDHVSPSPLPLSSALALIEREALIVAVCGMDIHKGKPLSDKDKDRLLDAVQRIAHTISMTHRRTLAR